MNIWIVTPTYNERDNLQPFLAQVSAAIDGRIVIVDDNSPDGTGPAAEQLRQTYTQLDVLHRPGKAGLGTAYVEGFRYALDRGADVIVQLDTDLSHPPEIIPKLVQALETADLAIASRYVHGGSMHIAWYRQWISAVGNMYIRALLGWGIRDWSTGFKAWRADLVRQLLSQHTDARGYAWLMEMTWRARQAHARIVELPLQFAERNAGESKFSFGIAMEDLRLAWALRRRGSRLAKD